MPDSKDKTLDEVRSQVQPAGPQKPTETFEVSGDEATLTKTTAKRVKSLEDLIDVCSIDTKEWYVERWVCNKWEMGSVPRATRSVGGESWVRPSTKAKTVELFQVKAWLVRADVKRLQGPGGKAEFLKQFREILDDDKHFKFQRRQIPTIVPRYEPEHVEYATVCSSDLHLTETVRPEDANGVNVYNSIIAANRLWEHSQKVKSILARHMMLYRIDKMWCPLVGDVINGTVHEEYIATNDLSDSAAVVLGTRLMAMFYRELATLGLPMEIDAVHGNHARLTPKMPTKRQAHTNLDWALYEHLADMLGGDDQIKINIVTAQIGTKKVLGWNYAFEHGIGVHKGKIDSFEDRLRALFDDRVYRDATGHTGPAFDQFVIGNLHTPSFWERGVINGSYIGQNELGQSWRLTPIRAQQLMWGITEKYPRTWQYAVDLTDIKSEGADNPFSEYATWFMKKHGK